MNRALRESSIVRAERRDMLVGALVLALSVTLIAWAIGRGGAP